MTVTPSLSPTAPPDFSVHLARGPADIEAAQRLRYDVFVRELGGAGPLVDHEAGIEADTLDPFCDHLLLRDHSLADAPVVGVYRLLRDDQAARLGRYYSEGEYDLAPLRQSGRRLMELGRSCLHVDYRGGTAMYELWNGLATYVRDHGIEVLFGVASFHGTDPAPIAAPLSLLHHRFLAPEELRVQARAEALQPMDLMAETAIDRLAAMRAMPALIKGYLRLGGVVGEGAWIDRSFNTIDICMVMDTARLTATGRALYASERSG